MKNIVVVIAHPDDEAFMCAGTIAKFAKTNDVYLVCATSGDADPKYAKDSRANLSEIRQKELLASSQILGVKKVHFLGFKDGDLCNNNYHELASKIQEKFELYEPETVVTMEPRGVSGHLDHVAVSLTTTYVFYKMPFVKKLMYYCISLETRALIKNYFIYFPPGYKKNEIDEVVDIRDTWDSKVQAIEAHVSQKKDGLRVLNQIRQRPKAENFMVLMK